MASHQEAARSNRQGLGCIVLFAWLDVYKRVAFSAMLHNQRTQGLVLNPAEVFSSWYPLQVQSTVDIDQPLFQPSPAEVVFHSYEPFKKYEATLHLRNNDTVCSWAAAHADVQVAWPHRQLLRSSAKSVT